MAVAVVGCHAVPVLAVVAGGGDAHGVVVERERRRAGALVHTDTGAVDAGGVAHRQTLVLVAVILVVGAANSFLYLLSLPLCP